MPHFTAEFTLTFDYQGGQEELDKLIKLSEHTKIPVGVLMKKLMLERCEELLKELDKKKNGSRTNRTRRANPKKDVSNKTSKNRAVPKDTNSRRRVVQRPSTT